MLTSLRGPALGGGALALLAAVLFGASTPILQRRDLRRLLAMPWFGAVLGPVTLAWGLQRTSGPRPASASSAIISALLWLMKSASAMRMPDCAPPMLRAWWLPVTTSTFCLTPSVAPWVAARSTAP